MQQVTRFSDEAQDCVECSEWITKNGVIVAPGKFHGERISTTHAYHVSLEGFADEERGGDGEEYCARVGNVVIVETTQGFVYGAEWDDDAMASRRFNE